jgi:crossover junction endodeoxyribonuclease RuvC
MRILGIDPGSTVTGFGVIEGSPARPVHVAHGTLRPPRSHDVAARLDHLHSGLREIARIHAPDVAVIERVFVAVNPRAALVLGQARGVALAAMAGERVAVAELAARQVKQAVSGSGAADKAQVQQMVTRLLRLASTPPQDAADALALALCQLQMGRLAGLGLTTGRRGRGRRAATVSQWTERRG